MDKREILNRLQELAIEYQLRANIGSDKNLTKIYEDISHTLIKDFNLVFNCSNCFDWSGEKIYFKYEYSVSFFCNVMDMPLICQECHNKLRMIPINKSIHSEDTHEK
jgi:hypothetical protein